MRDIPQEIVESSPRPWRCFRKSLVSPAAEKVFSTSVEVFLPSASNSAPHAGLLHVRGGVSEPVAVSVDGPASSPRPWRCFQGRVDQRQGNGVFSTSVEVFLFLSPEGNLLLGLLHVRGGVSLC